MNGYYKAELVRGPARPGPWKTVEDLELATLGWVHWHNNQRLHGYLGDTSPAEFEKAFYAAQRSDQALVEIQWPEPPSDPGRFRRPAPTVQPGDAPPARPDRVASLPALGDTEGSRVQARAA